MGVFLKDIGIDLGTTSIRVHVNGKGIVVRASSVIAVNKYTNNVIAFGNEAKEMIERTPEGIETIRPIIGGTIVDYDNAERLLKFLVDSALEGKGSYFSRERAVVSVPTGITEVEKRAVEEAVYQAGAREVYLIEGPMAAAIGANLPIEEPHGNMVVDIGGGISEMAVISLGGVVNSRSLRIAGDQLDGNIIQYLKKEHNILVGAKTAEGIKKAVGTAVGDAKENYVDVCGRDLLTGLPKNLRVSASEVEIAIKESINTIVDAIKYTLEKTPPELSNDIMVNGITLTGGGALLRGLDRLINLETGMPVFVAKEPLDCVSQGTGKVLKSPKLLKNVSISTRRLR